MMKTAQGPRLQANKCFGDVTLTDSKRNRDPTTINKLRQKHHGFYATEHNSGTESKNHEITTRNFAISRREPSERYHIAKHNDSNQLHSKHIPKKTKENKTEDKQDNPKTNQNSPSFRRQSSSNCKLQTNNCRAQKIQSKAADSENQVIVISSASTTSNLETNTNKHKDETSEHGK